MYTNQSIVNRTLFSEPVEQAPMSEARFSEATEQAFMFEEHIINKYGKETYSEVLVLLLDRLFRGETQRIVKLKAEISDSERLMEITLKNLELIVPEA